jgi:tetratricopeptide (TPR) repeat protein
MKKISKGPIPMFESESDQDEAEDLVYKAMELDGWDRTELITEALDLDPECIPAYHVLGDPEQHPAIAIAFFERGINIGAERFQSEEYIRENKGLFWGLTETRPFMRCLQGAADCQFALGRVFEAMGIWNLMLELNPNDNQGVRYHLMLCLAGFGDQERFDQLEQQFNDDPSAAAHFNRVLYLYTKHGPGPQALQALQVARAENKHVVPLLLKKDAPLYRVAGYTLGSEEEPITCMDKPHMVWSGVPGAKDWLKRVAGKPGK